MRLINADALEKTLRDWIRDHWTDAFTGDDAGSEFADMIEHAETIDTNPTVHAQGKPFNLPEIYIADGYDTIEGEDGSVGFGVYVPDENQIYVAGDVEGEIRARALLHEICHWVQAMCGRPFDEDEANEFSDIVYDALPSVQPEPLTDKEQKIFLAAMRREEKVCKQVDGLIKTCHEIIRKVSALWT